MTKTEIEKANKTCRSRGAVGKNALVPRVVDGLIAMSQSRYFKVLDFGAGKDLIHVKRLRASWPQRAFYGWDIGSNHTIGHLSYQNMVAKSPYDIVYASNVLNVLPNEESMRDALAEMRLLAGRDGLVVFNYPKSPRKSPLKLSEVMLIANDYFTDVRLIHRGVVTAKML